MSAKHELANVVLDPDSNLNEASLVSGVDELKRRLEVLLGAKAEAETDHSTLPPATTAHNISKMQAAAGQLVNSAFTMLGVATRSEHANDQVVERICENLLHCVSTDEQGITRLNLQLPDAHSLTEIAKALAVMMGDSAPKE